MSLLAPIAGGRRWYVRAPQGAPYPYLVLNRASEVPHYTLSGPDGYVATRMQIDVFGDEWPSVHSTAQSLQSLLSGFKGTAGGVALQGIFIVSIRDLPDGDAGPSGDRPVAPLFRTSIDIMIHHAPA